MTKKGPLSKAEKFYIANHLELDVKVLCKDLDRAQTSVNKFVETLPKRETVTSSQQDEKPVAPRPTVLDQFARNKKGGVVVMTPNASERTDDQRSAYRSKADEVKKRSGCVTTIRDTDG